jgi:outer membrane receptor protein involved in Fe transport
MKQQKLLITILLFLFMTSFVSGQGSILIKGQLLDPAGGPLAGANVYLKGTTTGIMSDLQGNFALTAKEKGDQVLIVSFIGMLQQEHKVQLSGNDVDLGIITMQNDAVGLSEVTVFANVAIDRKTPVPISNIKTEQIETRLGTQEYPELLKSTPGVYATKQGGAFGDSRINIRGFNSRNTATMINGVPVNDMESGWVYWSNWAGLSDVTRSMQVQRGLGASKIAIPSIGGTINILTKTTDAEEGGSVYYGTGSDNLMKVGFTVSTGLTDKNWASTVSIAKSSGNGFVDGTRFEAYSYYLNVSKVINAKQRLSLTIFGAPQWHNQRSTQMLISTYKDPLINNIRYNSDWGYKNGQLYSFRENYYHKPMIILNHFWDLSKNLNISTAFYVSTGTGGGTSPGGTNKFYDPSYLVQNQPNIDRIVQENIARGALGSETILRSSVNNHFWTGLLSTGTYKKDWLTISGGLDLRYYKGKHYQKVVDLLGGDFYLDAASDINHPNKVTYVGDKIGYWDDGLVLWEGLFGQAEADLGKLTAFVAGAVSNKSYSRVEYFLEPNTNWKSEYQGTQSPWYNFVGYSFKGGANYNLTKNHNLFFNTGYFQNQPDFRNVFYNYTNAANSSAPNEKVLSMELGYGYRSRLFSANVNGYYTTWKDKTRTIGYTDNGVDRFANLTGIDAQHMGIEVDMNLQPAKKLSINGMFSLGNWTWMNNIIDAKFFDSNNNLISTQSVYIKGVHVGDAAQTTAAVNVQYELLKGVKLGVDYNYYGRLYAYFDPETRTSEPASGVNPDAWKVPDYNLVDLFLSYYFKMGNYKATLTGNINNVFDAQYVSDARDGVTHSWSDALVYYGWGRSWVTTLKIKF